MGFCIALKIYWETDHYLSWGIGMIASSSTFRPIRGGSQGSVPSVALVYINHPREAAASTSLAIIFGRIASGVPWFFRSTAVLMQRLYQCRHCQCSVTMMLTVVALKQDSNSSPGGLRPRECRKVT